MGFWSDGQYATLQHADQPITHGVNDINVKIPKVVIMIMEYHNHKLQTKPMKLQGRATQQLHATGRQTKQSNMISLHRQDDCKTRIDIR